MKVECCVCVRIFSCPRMDMACPNCGSHMLLVANVDKDVQPQDTDGCDMNEKRDKKLEI